MDVGLLDIAVEDLNLSQREGEVDGYGGLPSAPLPAGYRDLHD
jgi:hypothetical protein